MDLRIQRTLATVDNVLEWSKREGKAVTKAAGVDDILEELRDLKKRYTPRLRDFELIRGRTTRGYQVDAWRKVLRKRMQTLRSAVRSRMRDESGKPLVLYVPPFRASVAKLIEEANAMELALRPRLQELIEKKMRPDLLDRINEASVQLWKWSEVAPDERGQTKGLRKELEELGSTGRHLIGHLRDRLAEDPYWTKKSQTEFESAAKVRAKPGPSPAKSKPKREATYRKRPKQPPRQPQRIEEHMTAEELQVAIAEAEFKRRGSAAS